MNPTDSRRSLLEQAYLKIREQKQQIEQLRAGNDGAIAVVGYACRLPGGGDDSQGFWKVLNEASDVFSEIGDDRWPTAVHHDRSGLGKGRSYTLTAGLLGGIDQFDAEFFGVPPLEAEALDPQQRLLLETSWHALEDAGIDPRRLRGTPTGVFIGLTSDDYSRLQSRSGLPVGTYTGLGSAKSLAAGRISYFYDFRGPTMQLDTSCSSVLVAAHIAARELRDGTCDLAMVGGANAIVSPDTMAGFCEMKALSRRGQLRAFDDLADGYVRGEGCGMLVLKRLADARRDGDRVHGVLLGSAMNHDGRTNGLTAPNPAAQEQVIRRALTAAGVRASDVQYVEAHGTGTRIGDVIEAKALSGVYGKGEKPLRIGSVKANIGHLEAAAGLPSLIKVMLSLKHERVPGQVNFDTHSSRINWKSSGLDISADDWQWPRDGARRIAGVSALGMSGTNVHAIVSECEPVDNTRLRQKMPMTPLLLVSARSENAMREQLLQYARICERDGEAGRLALVAASQCRRTHFERFREAVPAGDMAVATSELVRRATLPLTARVEPERADLAFVFNGQGTHHPAMAAELYRDSPVFRQAFDECAAVFHREAKGDLVALCCDASRFEELSRTENSQPATVAMGISLHALWRSLGLAPAAVVGHSLGEFAAAVASGSLTASDAMRLACLRGRAVARQASTGAMFAIVGEANAISAFVMAMPAGLALAAVNSPRQITVACGIEGVQGCLDCARATVVRAVRLPVAHAFHSDAMKPVVDEVRQAFLQVPLRRPELTWLGTAGIDAIDEPWSDAGYFVDQIIEPVGFQSAIERLIARGFRRFVEVGADEVLLASIRAIASDDAIGVVGSLRRGSSGLAQLSKNVASLYEMGVNLDWPALWDGPVPAIDLPLYPFQRRRHWWRLPAHPPQEQGDAAPLGFQLDSPREVDDERILDVLICTSQQPHLEQHQLFGFTVMAAASWIALALQIGQTLFDQRQIAIHRLRFLRPLVLGADGRCAIQVVLRTQADGFRFTAMAPGRDGKPVVYCDGHLATFDLRLTHGQVQAPTNVVAQSSLNDFYQKFAGRGYQLGSAFRWMVEGESGIEGTNRRLRRPSLPLDADSYVLFPGLIDSAFHGLAGVLNALHATGAAPELAVPAEIGLIHFHGDGGAQDEYFVHPRQDASKNSAISSMSGGLTISTVAGLPLLAMEGVTLRHISRAALERAVGSAPKLSKQTLQWQETPQAVDSISSGMRVIAVGPDLAALARATLGADASIVEVDALCCADEGIDAWRDAVVNSIRDRFGSPDGFDVVVVTETSLGVSGAHTAISIEDAVARACLGSGNLLEILSRWADSRALRLRVLCPGALRENPSNDDLGAGAIAGFLRSAALEYPSFKLDVLDCEQVGPEAIAAMLRALATGAPIRNGSGDYLLTEGRWSSRIAADVGDLAAKEWKLQGGVAIVTGGSGGLAPFLTTFLLRCGASEVLLLSRNCVEGPTAELGPFVYRRNCDVSSEADVARVFDQLHKDGKDVSAVIHAAGVLADGVVRSLSESELRTVLAPKLRGAMNLSKYWRTDKLQLVLAVSSLVSLFGSPGQASYGAANRFLDRWVDTLRAQAVPAATLNLGPVGAGMAARLDEVSKARVHRMGLGLMSPSAIADAAMLALSTPQGQLAVYLADPANALDSMQVRHVPRARVGVVDQEQILETLRRTMADLLGTESSLPSADAPMVQLGADSLFATEFALAIQAEFGLVVPMEVVLAEPTLRALAARINSRLSDAPAQRDEPASVAVQQVVWSEGEL